MHSDSSATSTNRPIPPRRLSAQAIRAVVFDLDGTLVDAFDDIAAAVNFGLRQLGFPEHPSSEIRWLVGDGMLKLAERALGSASTPERAGQLVTYLVEYYSRHPVDFARPYPGCVETLDTLRTAGIRTAVLSNKRHELTALVLERLGIASHLDMVVGEGPVERKPHPAGLVAIAERLAIDVEQCVIVGDGDADAALARNAGVPLVGVSHGILSREKLIELGAVTVLDRLTDLPPLLGIGTVSSNT